MYRSCRRGGRVLCAREPGKLFLDGTLGGGGHSGRLLEAGARVIALDKDPRALAAATARLARFGEAFRAVRADFRDAKNVLEALGLAGWTARWWTSASPRRSSTSRRAASPSREAGPLDMRMAQEGETLARPPRAASTSASSRASSTSTARSRSRGRSPRG